MNEDLKKRAEELEKTLSSQLGFAKHDSGDWLKIGGGILLGGILSYTLVRAFKGKKNKKTEKIFEVLEREGLLDDEVKEKLTRKKRSGILSNLGTILFPILLAYGKNKLVQRMEKHDTHEE